MERRRFLRDAARVGAGLGIAGTLSIDQVAAAALHESGQARTGSSAVVLPGTPVLRLDGEWSIAKDPENVGRAEQWFKSDLRGSSPARVPGVIQEAFPAYHGVAWYGRSFTAPANPNPQGRYLLRFGAVDYLADVWVNGIHVGGHEGGETPFVLDVTEAIGPKVDNRLTVRVLNPGNNPIDGIVLDETPHQHKRIPYSAGLVSDYG